MASLVRREDINLANKYLKGFGIKDSYSALSVKDFADGIVAGSVFVDIVGEGGDTIKKIATKTKELSLAIK